jgi:hypothetical protein
MPSAFRDVPKLENNFTRSSCGIFAMSSPFMTHSPLSFKNFSLVLCSVGGSPCAFALGLGRLVPLLVSFGFLAGTATEVGAGSAATSFDVPSASDCSSTSSDAGWGLPNSFLLSGVCSPSSPSCASAAPLAPHGIHMWSSYYMLITLDFQINLQHECIMIASPLLRLFPLLGAMFLQTRVATDRSRLVNGGFNF